MPNLSARPDLGQLRHQAKDLLRAARGGDAEALSRIQRVSDRLILASAQLAIARGYGFAGWPALKVEMTRRDVLNRRDVRGLARLLAEDPAVAVRSMKHWSDHPRGVRPLGYVAMLRFDARRLGLPPIRSGTGAVARALIEAGAPANGQPGEIETPLMTAASYGDADVARVLIEAGADLDARAAPDGGVPGGTALLHAAVFGMTAVLDVLVAAGARVYSLEEAAAAGDVGGWLDGDSPLQARIRALVMAADHQRHVVIDELLQAGTPIDANDEQWGRQALRVAACNGRVASVRHLLERGADPNARDPERGWTALEWCREGRRGVADRRFHDQVEVLLRPNSGSFS
jgi:ankyrin repeat protein